MSDYFDSLDNVSIIPPKKSKMCQCSKLRLKRTLQTCSFAAKRGQILEGHIQGL